MEQRDYFSIDIPVTNENFYDFNPSAAGFSQCTPGHYNDYPTPDFLLHYIVSGKGKFFVNGETHNLSAGNVFIIHPHQRYKYIADDDEPWYYIWIHFSGNLAKNFLSMKQVYYFDEPQLFFNIRDSINLTHHRSEYLYAQLLLIYRKLAPSINEKTSYAQIIRHQICTSYMEHLTVENLAEYCKIHRNYATRLFKKEFGMSIPQFLTQIRMKKSLEFLSLGYSVETVSEYVGFSDYNNFSRKFKQYFGVSPSQYKTNVISANFNNEVYIAAPAPPVEENLFYRKNKKKS